MDLLLRNLDYPLGSQTAMGKKHKSKKHHRKGTDASEGNKIRTDEI